MGLTPIFLSASEKRIEVELNTCSLQLFSEFRPNARSLELPLYVFVAIHSQSFENENVLQSDLWAFHSGHLGQAHQFPGSIRHAIDLNDEIDR